MEETQPRDIKLKKAERTLLITWASGESCAYPARFLRCQCRCAGCIHEMTGERLLDPRSVPEDIAIEHAELVGNYALKLSFSDGHDTGLYTWRHLLSLNPETPPG